MITLTITGWIFAFIGFVHLVYEHLWYRSKLTVKVINQYHGGVESEFFLVMAENDGRRPINLLETGIIFEDGYKYDVMNRCHIRELKVCKDRPEVFTLKIKDLNDTLSSRDTKESGVYAFDERGKQYIWDLPPKHTIISTISSRE